MFTYYVAGLPYSDDLYHSGVKNMKWYVRRYQNYDGSLTPLGRIHYGVGKAREATKKAGSAIGKAASSAAVKAKESYSKSAEERRAKRERNKEAKRLQKLRDDPSKMTDDELRKDIERLRLEKTREEAERDLARSREQAEVVKELSKKDSDGILKKDYKKMTTDELKAATDRLIAEKKYNDAMREYKASQKSAAAKVIGDLLSKAGSKIVDKSLDKFTQKLFEEKKDEELEASNRARKLAENLKFIRDNTPIKEITKPGNNFTDKTNRQIEAYKNRLIDLKQIKYLENEVRSDVISDKENTSSYNKTDRDNLNKNNQGGNQGQGKKKKKNK